MGEARRGDRGFTLIELMVTALVIAILIAIAIPTYLGLAQRARDKDAQSVVRNALTAAREVATDHDGRFERAPGLPADVVTMTAAEPAFQWVAHPGPAAVDVVGFLIGDSADGPNSRILLWTESSSGTWWGLQATRVGIVSYCKSDAETGVNSLAACSDPNVSW